MIQMRSVIASPFDETRPARRWPAAAAPAEWAVLIFSTFVVSSKIFNSGYPFYGLLLFFTVIVVALFKLIKFLGNK